MSGEEPSEIPEAVAMARPRSFPVPRNRPVLVDPELVAAATRGRRIRRVLAIVAVTVISVLSWYFTRPLQETPIPKPTAAHSEPRVPGDDPAVETYFQASEPQPLPPLEPDRTPLPVAPVSLDDIFGKE